RTRARVLRRVEPGAVARDHARSDRGRRSVRPHGAGHRRPGRHRRHSVRRRHVREPGGGARRGLPGRGRGGRGGESGGRGRAAADVKEKAMTLAASRLEVSVADLLLEDGRIHVRGAANRGLALGEIAAIASTPRPGFAMPSGMDPGLEATAYVPVTQSTYSSGAHAAVVEVDRETGSVRLLRYVAVDDCGTVINPMIVEGQVHGGIAHGVGNALLEQVIYDTEGQLVTGTLMDYAL